MEIIEEKKDRIVILTLNGRLDALTAKTLEDKFSKLIESHEPLFAINFLHLDYISSGGLRVLLKAAKTIKSQNGKLVLYSLQDYIREIFDIAGFLSIFSIYPDEKGALHSFEKID